MSMGKHLVHTQTCLSFCTPLSSTFPSSVHLHTTHFLVSAMAGSFSILLLAIRVTARGSTSYSGLLCRRLYNDYFESTPNCGIGTKRLAIRAIVAVLGRHDRRLTCHQGHGMLRTQLNTIAASITRCRIDFRDLQSHIRLPIEGHSLNPHLYELILWYKYQPQYDFCLSQAALQHVFELIGGDHDDALPLQLNCTLFLQESQRPTDDVPDGAHHRSHFILRQPRRGGRTSFRYGNLQKYLGQPADHVAELQVSY